MASVGEFKQIINYIMPMSIWTRFCDLKTELFRGYRDDKRIESINFDNFSPLNVLIKDFALKKFHVAKDSCDDVSYEELMAVARGTAAESLIKKLSFTGDEVSTSLNVAGRIDVPLGVYIKQPRGNNISFESKCLDNLCINLTNTFQTYPGEGFSVAFNIGEQYIALTPENARGIKGSGAVYLYYIAQERIYRADATEYIYGAERVLDIFRG